MYLVLRERNRALLGSDFRYPVPPYCRGDDETPIFFRIFPYFLRPFVRHLDLEPVVRSM